MSNYILKLPFVSTVPKVEIVVMVSPRCTQDTLVFWTMGQKNYLDSFFFFFFIKPQDIFIYLALWFWISEIICTKEVFVLFSFMEIEDNIGSCVTQNILKENTLQQMHGKAVLFCVWKRIRVMEQLL